MPPLKTNMHPAAAELGSTTRRSRASRRRRGSKNAGSVTRDWKADFVMPNSVRTLLATFTLLPALARAGPIDDRGAEFFEKKIRPVLVEHCYPCHSANAKKLRGGLMLDSRWGWQTGGESGPTIVAGEPEASLILKALRYESFEMPPKAKLPETVIADFFTWIEMGAVDPRKKKTRAAKEHGAFDLAERRNWWSLRPIQEVRVPEVKQHSWPRTSHDRFILSRLEKKGWQPAPPASRESWLRRVTYGLTGLPPTPTHRARFLDDRSPGAFETVVDRLLDSPHFGEHWARHWMDLVRYAESKSFEADYLMPNVFRYRDYLIRAFNEDVPYSQFVKEAIAGDLLEHPRLNPETGENESVIGPGFIYLTDGQHGPPDIHADEARIFEDMIDVVGKTFLGLTVACARCHDHKFDPITTADYYSLYGIIASSRLDYANVNSPRQQTEHRHRLKQLKTPIGAALADLLAEDLRSAREDLVEVKAGKAATPVETRWAEALKKKPNDELRILSRLLDAKDAGALESAWKEIRERGEPPGTPWLGNPSHARDSFGEWLTSGLAFEDAPRSAGDFVITPAGDRVVATVVGGLPAAGHLASRFAGAIRSPTFALGKRVSVRVKGRNVRVSLIVRHYELVGHGATTGRLTKVINSDSWQTVSFDTTLWVGDNAYLEVLQNGGEFHFAAQTGKHVNGAYAVVGTASNDHDSPPRRPAGQAWNITGDPPSTPDATLDHLAARLQALPEKWRTGSLSLAESDLLDALLESGVLDFDLKRSPALRNAVEAYRQLQAKIPAPKYVRSLADGAGEDEPVYIRGAHKNLSEEPNPRHFLDGIDGTPFHGPGSGRRQWAEALVSDSNPLTARVMTNRVWHHLFGRGIVNSVDDFGRMGSRPSHPGLLDFMAREFVRDGWSVKRLIRKLVLSSTYRTSSQASAESLRMDPRNVLLQHMPVRRLQAESIRDTILALGGALDPMIFGPSVGGGDGKRRSIYVQLRRQAMPPFLMLFDMPDGTEPFGRRNVTSSPTQSLELLNGELTWRVADAWARQILSGDVKAFDERIRRMHKRAFARDPTTVEIEWARGLLRDQEVDGKADEDSHGVWKAICHTMLNRKELLYVY